jgi:hypothetical protein
MIIGIAGSRRDYALRLLLLLVLLPALFVPFLLGSLGFGWS